MNAKTITLPSSHVAMVSHPTEVAKLIIEAASSQSMNMMRDAMIALRRPLHLYAPSAAEPD
jgi:hypothetical protein